MELRTNILLIILGTALVTFIPRVLPFIFLSKVKLSERIIKWLAYIPVAVLSALLAQSVLLSNGKIDISLQNLSLVATIPTLLIAFFTRSLIWTVMVGIIVMALLRFFL